MNLDARGHPRRSDRGDAHVQLQPSIPVRTLVTTSTDTLQRRNVFHPHSAEVNEEIDRRCLRSELDMVVEQAHGWAPVGDRD